eukprot:36871-Eustigmatos_ZCMA.PRE.1
MSARALHSYFFNAQTQEHTVDFDEVRELWRLLHTGTDTPVCDERESEEDDDSDDGGGLGELERM